MQRLKIVIERYKEERNRGEKAKDIVFLKALNDGLYDYIDALEPNSIDSTYLSEKIKRGIAFFFPVCIAFACFRYLSRTNEWDHEVSREFSIFLKANGWLDENDIVEEYIKNGDNEKVKVYCKTHLFADKDQEYYPYSKLI